MTVVEGCRSGLMGCSVIGSCSVLWWGGGEGGKACLHYHNHKKRKKEKEKKSVRTFRNRVPIIG
jgi:hypothetical protein